MSLVNRVSLFFLAALGVCLFGYSALSYVLIRNHLDSQFEHKLRSGFTSIVAAVEVESDGVKWQPTEHEIEVGDEQDLGSVRWIITDHRSSVVDRAHNLVTTPAEESLLLQIAETTEVSPDDRLEVGDWRVLRKRLAASAPKPDVEMDFDEFPELNITVALNTRQLNAELWQLTWLVCILPAGLWLVAAIVGRRYCRRALAPLRAMADEAHSMTQADFELRLPVAPHADELSDLAAAFNGLLDQLERAFEKQQRFTGDAAHQLRTPLTVLRGEIDVALRRPRTESDYRRVLETLSQQTGELQQIVETLLLLARTAGARSLHEMQSIPLGDWLTEAMHRWSELPRGTDLELHIESNATIVTSSTLLRQALDNLIENAMKYSDPGTSIAISLLSHPDSIIIAVDDAGMGICEDERTSIFEPFYRSAHARRSGVEGTGLGLTLVAAIVHALGGTVTCESRDPRGSRFLLCFPTTSSREICQPEGNTSSNTEDIRLLRI